MPRDGLACWRALGSERYDRERLTQFGGSAVEYFAFRPRRRSDTQRAWDATIDVFDGLPGESLQDRWEAFQLDVWPGWARNQTRPVARFWSNGVRRMQIGRVVRSDLELAGFSVPLIFLIDWLPSDDVFRSELDRLRMAIENIRWLRPAHRQMGLNLGLRLMLRCGYGRLDEVTEEDLRRIPGRRRGADALDGALCQLGVFQRTAMRGTSRGREPKRRSPRELADRGDMPERFRELTGLYLESYGQRVSDVYGTLRTKRDAIARFWRYIDRFHPAVQDASEITPQQGKPFVAFAVEEARRVRRREESTTPYTWVIDVRTFFADLIDWAAEPGSPFAGHAPSAPPLTRNDLRGVGFEKDRRRRAAKTQATVLDLEPEMPKIRAYALRAWPRRPSRPPPIRMASMRLSAS